MCFRHPVSRSEDVYLLVGDEVVVTEAGQLTHGLERFFASLDGKPVPGLACFTLALVSVQARRSFPIRVEQGVRRDAEKAASKAKAAAQKPQAPWAQRRPGRPKGSTNTPRANGTFTPEFLRLTGWLDALLHLIAGVVSLPSVVLDGHFGNHNALQMARQPHLHLFPRSGMMPRCPSPPPAPSPGGAARATLATRSMTTTSQGHTSKRPRSRGT